MPIFSIILRKSFIVKKAKIIEVKKPTIIFIISNSTTSVFKSKLSKIKAPNIVGIESKKANFEASLRFNPINSAAVIAVPDLEAPGINAKHWKIPMKKAVYNVIFIRSLLPLFLKKAKNKTTAKNKFAIAIL